MVAKDILLIQLKIKCSVTVAIHFEVMCIELC